MKALLFSLLMVTFTSEASYHRLWVGYKKIDIPTRDLLSGLNQKFFGETITVGGGKGLVAYQPYIGNTNGRLPDEVALVTYESPEKYEAIRATQEGQAYGKLHWDFFNKDNSKSEVPVPFAGELKIELAHELNPSFNDWQKGTTHVTIYEATTELGALARDFAELKKDPNLQDAVILVRQDYILEYRSLKTKSDLFKKLPLKILEHARLEHLKVGQKVLSFGEGANFSF